MKITYVVVIAQCQVQILQLISGAFEIIAKYEKQGKYLALMHRVTCDNYFIVKCLLKSNVASIFLLIASSFLNII